MRKIRSTVLDKVTKHLTHLEIILVFSWVYCIVIAQYQSFLYIFFEIYKIKAVINLTMLIEESGVERYISNNGDSSHSFGIYLFSFLGFSFTSLGFPFKKGVIKDYANFRPAT